MTGEVLLFRRRDSIDLRVDRKIDRKKWVERLATALFAAAIPTGIYGMLSPSTNLTRHLEEPIVDPFEPKNHNDDYLSGSYTPFLLEHKDKIMDAATQYNVPPEMIAGAIVKESYRRFRFEDWKDTAALAWNNTVGEISGWYADPSLGVGQVNVQTARSFSWAYEQQEKSVDEVQEELQDPRKNIEYVAMMLSQLMERKNRIPRGESLFDDPELVAVLATEYVRGPTTTALKDAVPNREGVSFTLYLGRIPCIRIFGDNATITEQQQRGLRQYAQEHIKDDSLPAITADAYKALLPSSLLPI